MEGLADELVAWRLGVPVAAQPPRFNPPDCFRGVARLSEAGAEGPLIKKKIYVRFAPQP
jgi:hypothetical protein